MKNKRVCPNCVADMEKEVRRRKAVHVCPDCGVVEMNSEEQESLIIKVRKDDKRRNYEDCTEVIIDHYLQQNGSSDGFRDI